MLSRSLHAEAKVRDQGQLAVAGWVWQYLAGGAPGHTKRRSEQTDCSIGARLGAGGRWGGRAAAGMKAWRR